MREADLNSVPASIGSCLTIDLGAIAANWRQLAARVAPGECAAVVKADAYGLGAAAVAPTLAAAGCRTFFVAHSDEAIQLRAVLPETRIGVLHGVAVGTELDFLQCKAVPVINNLGELDRWQRAAKTHGKSLQAFIHFDTGMNRLGLSTIESSELRADLSRLDGIRVSGWMSHFACPDEPDHLLTAMQLATFRSLIQGLPPAPTSLASSSAIFRGQQYHGDIARPGSALYGVNPTPEAANPMQPVVGLSARILQVRSANAGETVGYGASFRLTRPSRIATLAYGYADGFQRQQGNRGSVLIAGFLAPVLGRISMDLTTVDVSDIPTKLLEESAWATVIGPGRDVDAVAAAGGTIGYEILTGLGRRLHRLYLG